MRETASRFKLNFVMDPVKYELAAVLRERLALIADETSRRDVDSHLERLGRVSARIDALRAQLPAPVDPQLAHYLQRASYDKALAHLESTPSA